MLTNGKIDGQVIWRSKIYKVSHWDFRRFSLVKTYRRRDLDAHRSVAARRGF
jgi:hypothetical protein